MPKKKNLVILLAVLILIGIGFILPVFFTVKNIVLVTESSNRNLLGLNNYNGGNLLLLSPEAVAGQLRANNPFIGSITVEKQLPATLIIRYEPAESLVQLEVNGGFFVLADDGRIVSRIKMPANNLTRLHYYQLFDYQSFQTNDILDYQEIKDSLLFLKKARELGLKINTVDIKGTYMIALKMTSTELDFSSEKSAVDQIYQFETVVKSFKIQGRNYRRLDFRFDKPIVELK